MNVKIYNKKVRKNQITNWKKYCWQNERNTDENERNTAVSAEQEIVPNWSSEWGVNVATLVTRLPSGCQSWTLWSWSLCDQFQFSWLNVALGAPVLNIVICIMIINFMMIFNFNFHDDYQFQFSRWWNWMLHLGRQSQPCDHDDCVIIMMIKMIMMTMMILKILMIIIIESNVATLVTLRIPILIVICSNYENFENYKSRCWWCWS